MLTIWRVDAIHDLGGEVTHFYEDADEADGVVEQFRAWGWYADGYAESIEKAPPETLYQLCNRSHANAPTPTLLALCWLETLDDQDRVRLPDAAQRLEQLLSQMAEELGFEMFPAVDVEVPIEIEIPCESGGSS